MMRFIQNLLRRHLDPDTNVKPRVRGMFEDELGRMPDTRGENPDGETDHGMHEFHESGSNQKYAPTFRMQKEFKKGTLRESVTQADAPPTLSLRGATSEPLEADDDGRLHAEKPVRLKAQPSQNTPVAGKSHPLKVAASIDKVQIRHHPEIRLVKPSDGLNQIDAGSEDEGRTYAIPKTTHYVGAHDKGDDQIERPVPPSAPLRNVPRRRKEESITIALPPIQSPSKPIAQQVVNISIGKVEVRAFVPPAEVRIPVREERTERMTLDQYLSQQKSANR